MLFDLKSFAEKKILLIDDEHDLLSLLETVLKKEGFKHVFQASSGYEGIELSQQMNPDLIVLDIMLPDLDGYNVCQKIREHTLAPIFFLSAKGEDVDKLLGWSIGGDDYITKPFSPKEMAYRIKAYFRRNRYDGVNDRTDVVHRFGDITVDEKKGEVTKKETVVPLTAKEYQLLLFLIRHPNQVFSKAHLYETVWGEAGSVGYDNTVMVHLRHLREKLENIPSDPQFIVTIRGLGYKLQVKDIGSL